MIQIHSSTNFLSDVEILWPKHYVTCCYAKKKQGTQIKYSHTVKASHPFHTSTSNYVLSKHGTSETRNQVCTKKGNMHTLMMVRCKSLSDFQSKLQH